MNSSLPPEADGSSRSTSEVYYPAPPPELLQAYKPRIWLPIVLFFITLLSTTVAGISYSQSFLLQGSGAPVSGLKWHLIDGLPYAFAVVGILLAHELGHYLACRYYGIAATLPHFIPFPSIIGTMGAFIRIRSPFGNRKQLFDVGVAGPLAGYVFALPALIVGLKFSQVIPFNPDATDYVSFGEPLIFKALAHLFFNYSEATQTLNLHPIGWAAWFGIFATSINLFPAGQLDGGHLVYAIVGPRRHRVLSIGVFLSLLALSAITWSAGYLLFIGVIAVLGLRHPPCMDEMEPLGTGRKQIALLAALIFALSFIPVPITLK